MARVLIAGCGYVGSALGALLVGDSHRVFGLRRNPVALPPGIEPVAADLAVPSTLHALPPDLDFVFYLASPGGSDDAHYRSAYVDGLRHLLERLDADRQRPRRVVLATSTAVYAQKEGEWVDEASPAEPVHFSGLRLLEAEQVLAAGAGAGTAVRFGGIYGPRRTGLLDRVRSGRAVYRSHPPQYTNRIHRDDCAGLLRHLMHVERPPPVLLGVDGEPASEGDVLAWLAGALGAAPPRALPEGDAALRPARGNKRCRNDGALRSGYRFRHPSFREGYGALIEAMR